MSWILALYLVGEAQPYIGEFKSERECMVEMRKTIRSVEDLKADKIDRVTCTEGVVVGAIDE